MSRHGRAVVPFGKWKGCAVRNLPTDYLDWLAGCFANSEAWTDKDGEVKSFSLADPKWNWLRESVIAEMRHRGLNVDALVEEQLRQNFADTESDNPSEWGWPIYDKKHVELAIKNYIHMPPGVQAEAMGKILTAAHKFGITNFKLGAIEVREKQTTLELHPITEVPKRRKARLKKGQFSISRAEEPPLKVPHRRILLET